MPRYAVSHIDWFDHELSTLIVQADTWDAALRLHPKIAGFEIEWTDLASVRQQAFDCDAMFECVEIPDATQA